MTVTGRSWLRLTRSSTVRAGLAQRARIVLLAADGVSNTAIADRVGVSRPTVIGWRERYRREGIAGLDDEHAVGAAAQDRPAAIVAATLTPPPKKYGVTHWSTRLLARHWGSATRRGAGLARATGSSRGGRRRSGSPPTPSWSPRSSDVVGLYLAPPENAIVLCVDEKSQIQALDRTAPILPMQPGLPERRSHDYVRHGTTTLFAALEIATGRSPAPCKPRHRHQEFLAFLKQVATRLPRPTRAASGDGQLRRPQARRGQSLAGREPPVHVHFTPTSRVLDEPRRGLVRHHRTPSHPPRHLQLGQRPQRQDPRLHRRLERPRHPFVWTKTADQILKKANRQNTSNAGH